VPSARLAGQGVAADAERPGEVGGGAGPFGTICRESILRVAFYASRGGHEPVRDWLRGLDRLDRQAIGADLTTAHFGWPMGMPLIRKLDVDLWGVRTRLRDRVVRTLFTVEGDTMVILHAFVKKGSKAPGAELGVASRRLARLKGHLG
jgi:phage-related protein